jgi:superfamily II DNA or RNA helicase
MIKLRPWQAEATKKAIDWLVQTKADKHFLINAAPGAGKTIAACAIAAELFQMNEIDRVIVIAPRSEVVNQWAKDFQITNHKVMAKVTGIDGDVSSMGIDVCATWAAIQGLQHAFQDVCQNNRTLIICDEHHHAAVEAAWGDSADSAFVQAKFVLVLTGTPIRSDGAQSVWMAYHDSGAINHPVDGTYTLTYGQAVDLGYCRPITFHRHDGRFTVDLNSGESTQITGSDKPELTKSLKKIPGLQRALDFYKLACTPQFQPGTKIPLLSGYQATMLEAAMIKLDDLRHRMPKAGGLVIAPTIEMAKYFVQLITIMEGDAPMLVHSQLPNADGKIAAFRNSDKKWLVSVAMVSEGVDIPRLRVLVYLPSARTELAFRQAVGRVVRTTAPDDDTRAYVVMPTLETFEVYARRVEEEIPHHHKKDTTAKTKKCPICNHENPLGAAHCTGCGHEFPKAGPRVKPCPSCGMPNLLGAKTCTSCGKPFTTDFNLKLDEALRTGAIIRGMDITESEVLEAEKMATHVRKAILQSGDARLIKLLQVMPEEILGHLKQILDAKGA